MCIFRPWCGNRWPGETRACAVFRAVRAPLYRRHIVAMAIGNAHSLGAVARDRAQANSYLDESLLTPPSPTSPCAV
jgi:hypothetical protein